MDQLTPQTKLASWIDDSLDYLTCEWAVIPEIAEEWESWDEIDRLDFVLEWPLRESRFLQLQQWSDEGLLTAAQRHRFANLESFMQRHRATLDELLAD
jgi:hypothetical protein